MKTLEVGVTQTKFKNMKLTLNKLFTAPLAALVMGGFTLTASAGTEAKAQTTDDDLKATDETPAMTWFVDNRGGRGMGAWYNVRSRGLRHAGVSARRGAGGCP